MSKLLIIEDELLIAAMTENIAKTFGYEVVAIARNLQEAFLCLRQGNFDVAAVDINLGTGLDGLEIGRELHNMGIPFFYLTSYESGDIIRKATETCPGTYLIKPFNPAQLLAALEVSLQQAATKEKRSIILEDGTVRHQLYLDEILYVKADNVYIDIHTKQQQITLRMSLKAFRDIVPDELFLQPHRSYLVNPANITKVCANDLWFGSRIVPIARTYKQEIAEKLKS